MRLIADALGEVGKPFACGNILDEVGELANRLRSDDLLVFGVRGQAISSACFCFSFAALLSAKNSERCRKFIALNLPCSIASDFGVVFKTFSDGV